MRIGGGGRDQDRKTEIMWICAAKCQDPAVLLLHQVPVEFIESKSGFNLLPRLDRASARDLCVEHGCRLIAWDKFELYFIQRKLEAARTRHRLDKVWAELGKKGIKPDDALVTLYETKCDELRLDEATVGESN